MRLLRAFDLWLCLWYHMTEYAPVALIDRVELNPSTAQRVFDAIDGAFNLVLPGSDYHQRYPGAEEVGLAVVVARDLGKSNSYNPLDRDTQRKLFYIATNRGSRPGAWLPGEKDKEMLGGPVPEWLGRFGAFALAKVNLLSSSPAWEFYSHRVDTSSVQPGEFGYAGGLRWPDSFEAVSGLWEVHDHVGCWIFKHRVEKAGEVNAVQQTADELANTVESILGDVQRLHDGTRAEELTRNQVSSLLVHVDNVVNKRLYPSPSR